MKIKISEEKYVTITARAVGRVMFLLLSVAMAAAVCKKSLSQGRSAVAKLDKELQSVSFPCKKTAVYVGDALEIEPVAVPKNAEVSYTWELADDGVLTVEKGKIVGAGSGETVLGVTSGDHSAQVTVVVKHKPLPEDSTLPPLYYETLPLANYCNTLPSDYAADDLMKIPTRYVAENYTSLYVSAATFQEYLKLLDGMRAELGADMQMHIISAYRSYARQTELYDKAVKGYMAQGKTSTEARALALQTTQTPGNSEHQMGNTIDVSNNSTTDHNYQNTPEEYGFIIRYPADKEDITRIEYEPWHIRYVGVNHAAYMYLHNLCLEEYVELQEKAAAEADDYALEHPATAE